MTTYKEIFGKTVKVLTGDPAPTPVTFTITVANPGSGNKYYIDGVQQKTVELYEGNTYNFDYSAATSHPFRFSTTSDGTHNSGTEYTTGVTVNSNITTIVVASGAPNLFYYCSSHSGMGGTALTPASPSEYEGQIWYNNTTGKFRSIVAGGAWSSGAPLATYRYGMAAGGTQTAAFVGGGYKTPAPDPVNVTEEYDGTGWSSSGNMNTARMYIGGSGTQTAGLAAGGDQYPSPRYSTLVEEYNGTAWSVQNVLPTQNKNMGSCGIQNASLNFGGSTPSATNVNNLYDGTNWTNTGHNLNTARLGLRGAGTSTAALASGGSPNLNTTEEYNGSSWTSVSNSTNTFDAHASSGTQTAAGMFGGGTPTGGVSTDHNNYDGTTWTAAPSLALGRYYAGMGPIGTQSSALCAGGNGPSSPVAGVATEEYNFTLNTVTAGAWSAGGNLNTARASIQGAGIQAAAWGMGGELPGSTTNATENYDGTSWTTSGTFPVSTRSAFAFGTQTAGLAAGGNSSPGQTPYNSASAEYDGSSWTASGGGLAPGKGYGASSGTQTSALATGGDGPPNPSNPFAQIGVQSYNGSTWSTETNYPTTIYNGTGAGASETDAVVFGGEAAYPGNNANTADYNGSAWTLVSGSIMDVGNPTTRGTGGTNQSPGSLCGSVGGQAGGVGFYQWNNTAWSTLPNMGTGGQRGTGGTLTAAIAFGGNHPGEPRMNDTEEFTAESTSLNTKNISSS